MLLPYAAEYDRATDSPPFSNGFEGESWTAANCDSCVKEPDCPLILVAVMNRTPAQWTLTNPGGLSDKFTCAERVPTGTCTCGRIGSFATNLPHTHL